MDSAYVDIQMSMHRMQELDELVCFSTSVFSIVASVKGAKGKQSSRY